MTFLNNKNIFCIFYIFSQIGYANSAPKIVEYPLIAVDESNINVFSTPLSYYQGALYTVNVEPTDSGLSNGVNLKTVVREALSANSLWKSHIIDNETIEDKYHTQPSIGVDKLGFLHIVYGMHNMPWQYVISNKPGDISSFTFHGDPISSLEKFVVKHLNKTPFPTIGLGGIPNNQITYPAFFYDNTGELYVTYRSAIKPKRAFKDRIFSANIAKYDTSTKTWMPLGGNIQINKDDADWPEAIPSKQVKTFAFKDQWTAYLPRLAFDSSNGMHVSWLWREGLAGPDATKPSYAYKPDGKNDFFTSKQIQYDLPISVETADWIGPPSTNKFLAISDISTNQNYVYVVLQIYGKDRVIFRLNRLTGNWQNMGPSPYGASTLRFDSKGGQWAFATGLTVLYRKSDAEKWKIAYKDKSKNQYGYSKVLQLTDSNTFYIHTQSANEKLVKIYKLVF